MGAYLTTPKVKTTVQWVLILGIYSQRRSDKRAPLRHCFCIPRPRSHINLYIEYDINYKKGAQRRTDVIPPLIYSYSPESVLSLELVW